MVQSNLNRIIFSKQQLYENNVKNEKCWCVNSIVRMFTDSLNVRNLAQGPLTLLSRQENFISSVSSKPKKLETVLETNQLKDSSNKMGVEIPL